MGILKLIDTLKLKDELVQKDGKNIIIGNGMVSDFITILEDGSVKGNWMVGDGNSRYCAWFDILTKMPQEEIKELITSKDIIDGDIFVVWTATNGKLVKKECLAYGYPNITLDGYLQYDNTFFKEKRHALAFAQSEARYKISADFERWISSFKEIYTHTKRLIESFWQIVRAYVFIGRV